MKVYHWILICQNRQLSTNLDCFKRNRHIVGTLLEPMSWTNCMPCSLAVLCWNKAFWLVKKYLMWLVVTNQSAYFQHSNVTLNFDYDIGSRYYEMSKNNVIDLILDHHYILVTCIWSKVLFLESQYVSNVMLINAQMILCTFN